MERSSSRSTIEATMRLFLLRSLNSCSDLLNSPPFKALPLFEKPHVRAAPSRFAHSAPKQGHRASRAFANPLLVSRWGLFQSNPPCCKNFICYRYAKHTKCSFALVVRALFLFNGAAVDGGFHQNASHGRPQVDPRPCPRLRVEIPRHAITVVTGVSGSGKALWFWTP